MKKMLVILAMLTGLLPVNGNAAVYKCTDAAGKATYQQQPCPGSASEHKLKVTGGSGWVSLRTGTNQQGSPTQLLLNAGSIETLGPVRRATFKDVFEGPTGGPDSLSYYYYYDCAAGTISGAITDVSREQFEQQLSGGAKGLLFPYAKLAAVYSQPHADADIVAHVCN